MKTLLLSFLMLFSINIFAQSSPTYLRAHTFSMGVRETKGKQINWVTNNDECSILIECYTTKVVINSKQLQTYYIVNQEYTPVEGQVMWRCKNADGYSCNIKMTTDPKYPQFLAFEVEFDDALWFYICSKN